MPCFLGGETDKAGLKWVGGYPPNQAKELPYITGIMLLNDPETGFPLAAMDASWITAWRTGAASGVCARHMASPDASAVGMVGLGVQARTNLLAMKEVLPNLKDVRIYDLYRGQIERFRADMAPLLPGVRFEAAQDPISAMEGADVAITCVPIVAEPERFIPAEALKKDSLAISVDYDSAFEADVMIRAEAFVCDDRNQYLETQAHGVYFQKGYPEAEEIYADMGEICAGRVPAVLEGRRAAVLMGIASHDVMTASLVLERAQAAGVGIMLEL
jgi:ornithine cyclodeaminase/alanine dehydrogenase